MITVKEYLKTATRTPHSSGNGVPTVLVVEDSPTQAMYMHTLLDQENLNTVLASNGRQGIEMARALHPDLIIMDMEMPELNGDQVLAMLKDTPELSHIPVIIVSALDDIDKIAACIEMGAEDYLAKPFNAVLLHARVAACLEKKRLRDQEFKYMRQIEGERARFDELLHVIMPHEIVEELQETGMVKPRLYPDVAVLFADVVDFTPYCNSHSPEEIFINLQLMAEAYESIAMQHGLLKIKTMGDAFLATAGMLTAVENPVERCVRCGLEMLPVAQELPAQWNVRIGVHVGPVMAGVVGRRQYLFDVWGNTVNTAQRVESHGAINALNLSRQAWERVANRCQGQSLGTVPVKGKGDMEIYQVTCTQAAKRG